jgi:hypothetical protein
MTKRFLVFLVLAALVLSGCAGIRIGDQTAIVGSGKVASEPRTVSGFTAISLEGSGDVHVAFGDQEAAVVEAEDNLLPLIETVVQGHTLVIRTRPNTTITPTKPVLIQVTMKSLEEISVPGSGNVTAPDLAGDALKVGLPGSGTITLDGTANLVDIRLSGSGSVFCDKLQAKTAAVTISGSGNVSVYASESLDATISGSGDIHYSGNPAKVNKNVTGSGNIRE